MITLNLESCDALMTREQQRFYQANPRSHELFEASKESFLNGVPMNWMTKWACPFPLFAEQARDSHLVDVDGHRHLDLCLGDTAAFFGHSPAALRDALAEQANNGLAMMMPTEDVLAVGAALQRHFGLKYWQVAMTATDANRFAIRLARAITGRHKVLVFNGCYHGSLVETLVELDGDQVVPNEDSIGGECDPASTTRIVEFNDVNALAHALSFGDVACVLAEPVMTNCGVVLPDEGFHDQLRSLTREHGALLLIDETHSIATAAGGYTKAFALNPDILTLGKSAGGGVPVAVFGFSAHTKERIDAILATDGVGIYAVGGTLAGNALSMRALKVTLESLMTDAAFETMTQVAEVIEAGIVACFERYKLPWYTLRIGACVSYGFHDAPPRNGGQAMAEAQPQIDHLLHLFLINRGILITPFQNQLLVCPQTTLEDAAYHTEVFGEFIDMLVSEAVIAA